MQKQTIFKSKTAVKSSLKCSWDGVDVGSERDPVVPVFNGEKTHMTEAADCCFRSMSFLSEIKRIIFFVFTLLDAFKCFLSKMSSTVNITAFGKIPRFKRILKDLKILSLRTKFKEKTLEQTPPNNVWRILSASLKQFFLSETLDEGRCKKVIEFRANRIERFNFLSYFLWRTLF